MSNDDIYDPNKVQEILRKQKADRRLRLYTCPLCKKDSLAAFVNKEYLECQNINCRAIGVPTSCMTKINIANTEINVFTPE